MDKHHGEILEYTIRKKGISIKQLAHGLNVNRGSLYNFFKSKHLKHDVIYKVGLLINHDFSQEFPEIFSGEEFETNSDDEILTKQTINAEGITYWKEKYIKLLEAHNQLLSKIADAKQ